jgi:ATP-dependent DNA ligase
MSVPIGAWYGNGRKAQKGFLSPVLLAVYDEDEDVFRSICRSTSFTDGNVQRDEREFYFKG